MSCKKSRMSSIIDNEIHDARGFQHTRLLPRKYYDDLTFDSSKVFDDTANRMVKRGEIIRYENKIR